MSMAFTKHASASAWGSGVRGRGSETLAGCWVLGVGCWVLGTLDSRLRTPDCGWVLGVGCWVLGVGCWVLGTLDSGLRTPDCGWVLGTLDARRWTLDWASV